MTAKNAKCQKPENLKGLPQECSPEQIRECHRTDKAHSCVERPLRGKSDT
jgi:hypothetical protein